MNTRLGVILACALLAGCGQERSDGSDTDVASSGAAGSRTASVASAPPAFAICASCHAVAPGRQGVGPSLAGVFGRKAASQPGFAYSDALKRSGIVWDAKSLDQWLQGPMKMVPGTRMVIGLPNPEARQSVIAYMETLK